MDFYQRLIPTMFTVLGYRQAGMPSRFRQADEMRRRRIRPQELLFPSEYSQEMLGLVQGRAGPEQQDLRLVLHQTDNGLFPRRKEMITRCELKSMENINWKKRFAKQGGRRARAVWNDEATPFAFVSNEQSEQEEKTSRTAPEDKLPGPPQNVRVDFIDNHSVDVIWDPPFKNAHTVELYRVIVTNIDSSTKESFRKDTAESQIKIDDLKAGTTYQVTVRAGNSRGTSSLTAPLKFSMADEHVTSTASRGEQDGHVGAMVAVGAALVVIAAILVAAVWFVRRRRLLGVKDSDGVAFENPSYLKEVNMDHIRVPQSQNDSSKQTSATNNASSSTDSPQWISENLHVPAQQEVDPTLYEELKLGQNGAGFKRLKP
ncbi:unnamed protein product [Phaedon cochleariae]|uniref:Fibronectin type-III domain-containing protein n=1 Tax=Phaedon cochleariae TaxID=80249 RepID=A0A9N9SDW6_PHACE|nr:unnamed protein product [Phaedon cochleariae]